MEEGFLSSLPGSDTRASERIKFASPSTTVVRVALLDGYVVLTIFQALIERDRSAPTKRENEKYTAGNGRCYSARNSLNTVLGIMQHGR